MSQYGGGASAVADEVEEKVPSFLDKTAEGREYLSPEYGKPWTPVEDAKIEEIDAALEDLEEVGFSPKEYREEIKKMNDRLAAFKRNPSMENYKALSGIKLEVYKFDYRVKDRGPQFEKEFFAKVDVLLKDEKIEREALVKETWKTIRDHAQNLREAGDIGQKRELGNEAASQPSIEKEKPNMLKRFFR